MQAPLFAADGWRAPLPLRVGNVYQNFSNVAEGRVENIIQLSVPFLLEEGKCFLHPLLSIQPCWASMIMTCHVE